MVISFTILLIVVVVVVVLSLSSLLSLSVNDRLPYLRDVVEREQDDFFSIKVIVIVTKYILIFFRFSVKNFPARDELDAPPI